MKILHVLIFADFVDCPVILVTVVLLEQKIVAEIKKKNFLKTKHKKQVTCKIQLTQDFPPTCYYYFFFLVSVDLG